MLIPDAILSSCVILSSRSINDNSNIRACVLWVTEVRIHCFRECINTVDRIPVTCDLRPAFSSGKYKAINSNPTEHSPAESLPANPPKDSHSDSSSQGVSTGPRCGEHSRRSTNYKKSLSWEAARGHCIQSCGGTPLSPVWRTADSGCGRSLMALLG